MSIVFNHCTCSLSKEVIDKQTLEGIKTSEGKSLADIVALSIGKIGENIQLMRGVKFVCPSDLSLVAYAHPAPVSEEGLFGKYAAVVAFKNVKDVNLAHQLTAHIVGKIAKEVFIVLCNNEF